MKYTQGQLVERISTGERAQYEGIANLHGTGNDHLMLSITCEGVAIIEHIIRPASQCRTVEDDTIGTCSKCGYKFDTNDERMEPDGNLESPDKGYCPACSAEMYHINVLTDLGLDHAAELVAKDAHIAELEARLAGTEALLEMHNDNQFIPVYQETVANLRKLCGDVITVLSPMYEGAKLRRSLMESHGKMGMIEDVEHMLFKRLRKAAEGE